MLTESDPDESVWDPFFVPYVGWALATQHASSNLLDLVWQKDSVALIAAVEHLPSESSEVTSRILVKARSWLESAFKVQQSLRDDAFGLLSELESPHVMALTEGLGFDPRLLLARFRNGDASSGVLIMAKEFLPAIHHQWMETLIRRVRSRYQNRLVSEVAQVLGRRDIPDHVLRGALILAGYLGDDALALPVKQSWDRAADHGKFLMEAMWAALRCSNEDPEATLCPLFAAVLELKDDGQGGALSERQNLIENLQFATRHGFSDTVYRYLAKLGQREEYQTIVAAILDRVTHPVAVEFTTRTLALLRHRAEERGDFSPRKPSWGDEMRMRRSAGDHPFPHASGQVLRILWQSEENPEWLRKFALDLWVNVGGELSYLQSISESSTLYESAIWHRAQIGDVTCASRFVKMMGDKPWWLQYLARVWCEQAAEALDHLLTSAESSEDMQSNGSHFLAAILRDIPTADGERLLFKHWQGLRHKPRFIQVALYLSTQESRTRAAESIGEVAADARVFERVSMFFGFMTLGLSEKLSARHLESLRPYIRRLGSMCIVDMLNFCKRHGLWDWATEVLRPECYRRAEASKTREYNKLDHDRSLGRRYFPTDEELLESLDSAQKDETRRSHGHLWFWLEEFSRRGDSPERAFQLAERWLTAAPTIERYKIVATLMYHAGSRQRLSILETSKPVCETAEGAAILADVTYAVRRRSPI
jgi:hypothetical protein